MANNRSGFNQGLVSSNALAVEKEARAAFVASLLSYEDQLSLLLEPEEEANDPGDEEDARIAMANPVHFSGRVVLPTNQPLDAKRVAALNALYAAEGEALDGIQDLTLRSMMTKETADFDCADASPPTWTPVELIAEMQATHDKVRQMVDQATTASKDTRSAGLTTGRDRRINRDGEILLNEFFEKCQAPNDAEVQMLATVCGVETWDIQRWFGAKLEANRKLFHFRMELNKEEIAGMD
ncbi:hypothetical protein BDY17DRAFT_320875 [Neohortaea acidophila]|uniref:Homeobox domain-containing protein n=1 Tax=Neohortaea acidophila TaxID=245834 RepID=A0A6A6Q1B5_9PEZI|nr:uncharacterized protein BDY17DRAFT_320875 [Neohortaea acidophila]KAF2486045.1 hypothetical protein BDY17DRAFT_320875 [Neohortaea acidophila]